MIGFLVNLYDAWDAAEPGKSYADQAAKWWQKPPEENGELNVETSRRRDLKKRIANGRLTRPAHARAAGRTASAW